MSDEYDNKNERRVTRQEHENIINHIYVNHISQLEKDMIGIKKEQEFQGRDISTLKGLVNDLVIKMDAGLALGKKTWWLLVGAVSTIAVVGAVIKLVVPLLSSIPVS